MEFKVVQKEIELQSRGWVPTFHDVTKEVNQIVRDVSCDLQATIHGLPWPRAVRGARGRRHARKVERGLLATIHGLLQPLLRAR
jgi:hypothetical protein